MKISFNRLFGVFVLVIACSCSSVSDQEMKEQVRTGCEPFDSLSIFVWHTVYDGAYIGNCCARGETQVRSFTAQYDAGFIQKQLGWNLDHKPININLLGDNNYLLDEKDSENSLLTDIIRMMQNNHIISIKKGQSGLVFVRGDFFHSATEYKELAKE